jgi:hypothetical protein
MELVRFWDLKVEARRKASVAFVGPRLVLAMVNDETLADEVGLIRGAPN